ncbi:hypothetical protein IGI04_009387 [Brassica rapa subsp. trilocularis]|uniref:Stress-response A/B barrel domain-containing protein n=1 Tax=Brassica rapa subsp. trilocularis TaxID=1813537 RepID=A0ABQ7MX63_BRACM|nr:hypothetical protein IGI04_009387 [Brassica rapa subsp. trilocularis]
MQRQYSRYRSKDDLSAYFARPNHIRVVEETMQIWEDIMAVETGSPIKRLWKWFKKKYLAPVIDEIRVGENFSPVRAKGFSIASVAYFKDLGNVEQTFHKARCKNIGVGRKKACGFESIRDH